MNNYPVMVCVIDSGIYATQVGTDLPTSAQGFVGGVAPGRRQSLTNQCRFNWNQGDIHGGHVFGTVAAVANNRGVRGVISNGGRLRHCNVFGTNPSTSDANILNAVGWHVNQRNAAGSNINLVISMSLGGSGTTTAVSDEYARLTADQKTMIIAAAGNGGPGTISYPAAHPGVVSVCAVDRNSNVAGFSATNDDVEICGPGVTVQSWHGPTSPAYATVALTGALTATINAPNAASMFGTSSVSGRLVYCGLAGTTCAGVTGSICLVDRGEFTFCQKAASCRAGGGIGMLLVDNANSCSPPPAGFSLSGCTTAQQLPTVMVSGSAGAGIRTAVAAGTVDAVLTPNVFLTSPPVGPLQGTSMATPHVSAATAVVWASRPSCPAAVVRQVIKDSATKPANLFPNGPTCNAQAGCGIINIPAAIARLATATC